MYRCQAPPPRTRPAIIGNWTAAYPKKRRSASRARALRRASLLPAHDAALALGLVPDFLDEAFVRLDAELDHDVDQG